MKNKKIVAIALCCAMLYGTGAQVMAVEDTGAAGQEVSENVQAPDSALYYGTVTAVDYNEENEPVRVTMNSERYGEMVFHVGAQTYYVDGGKAMAADSKELLQEGQGLYVYHSSAVTASLPPQSAAYTFVGNMPMDMGCPKYHEVENLTKNEDGSVTITTDNGSLFLTVAADAKINPYLTKNLPTIDDIKVGGYIMAWYDVVLESYPAQGGTNQVLLLSDVVEQKEEEQQPVKLTEDQASMKISINGQDSGLTYVMQDDVAMVPLRAVAEAMGLTAGYAVEDGRQDITAESDQFAVHMTPGENKIYGVTKIEDAVGMTAPQDYGTAPYIDEKGYTWAPAELFQMLGVTVELDAQGLHLSK